MTNNNAARRLSRIAAAMKALELDEAKAAEMVGPLAGLDDAEFSDHVSYLAARRAGVKWAQSKVIPPMPQQTTLPAPAAAPPTKVEVNTPAPKKDEQAKAEADADRVEKTQADVARYMRAAFGVDCED